MLCWWRKLVGRILVTPGMGALAILLAACSMHPLPDDVTRVSTVDIVKSIRCEALAGIDSLTPQELARARPILDATVIGFDFLFNIDENNSASGDPKTGLLTFANGSKFSLNTTGSATLDRRNLRRFTIIDALADLPKPENRAFCSDRTRTNWVYPIGGKIGMDEVVRTYLKLEMITELQRATPTNDPRVKERFTNVVFSDDLSFTTHIEVGAKTKLVLDAVIGELKVTNAALNVGSFRDDAHSVIVALTRKKIAVDEPAARDRAKLLTSGAIRDPRTQAQLIQIDAEARTRVAMELYRRRGLNDVDNEPARALGQRFLDVLKVP
jgi:hypothetical protein